MTFWRHTRLQTTNDASTYPQVLSYKRANKERLHPRGMFSTIFPIHEISNI